MSDSILDRVVVVARADVPPRLDPVAGRQMIETALAEAAPQARPWRPFLAFAIGVAAVVAFVLLWPAPRTPSPMASELTLPTGDRIATTPGAQLEVANVAPEARAVRLLNGTALFDVRPLGDHEHFVVHTPDSEVTVVGTIFTVEVVSQSTIVRVYEGKVRVRRGDRSYTLEPNQQLAAGGDIGIASDDALAVLATARARERATADHKPVAPPPAIAAAALAEAPASVASPSNATSSGTSSSAASPSNATSSATSGSAASPRTAPSPAQTSSQPAASTADTLETSVERLPAVTELAYTPADANALLAAGKFDAARDLAREHGWDVIEGDAHRALGAYAAAATAYERAIGRGDACVAALLAARVHSEHLAHADRALELLLRASEPACATRERALAQTIQIATRIKRPELGAAAARAYLADYPNGDQVAAARLLVAR